MVQKASPSTFAGTDLHISTRSVHPAPSNMSSPTSNDDAFTALKPPRYPLAHTVYVGSDHPRALYVKSSDLVHSWVQTVSSSPARIYTSISHTSNDAARTALENKRFNYVGKMSGGNVKMMRTPPHLRVRR